MGVMKENASAGSSGGGGSPSEGLITENLKFAVDANDFGSYSGTTFKNQAAETPEEGTLTNVTTSTGHHDYNGSTSRTEWTTVPAAAANIFANTGGGTIQILAYIDAASGLDYLLDTTNGSALNGYQCGLQSENVDGVELYFRIRAVSTSGVQPTLYSSVPKNRWVVLTWQFDEASPGTPPKLWCNKHQLELTGPGSTDTWTDPVGAFGDDSSNPLTLGSVGGGGDNFDGKIEAVLMYAGQLDRDAVHQNVEHLLSRFPQEARGKSSPAVPTRDLLIDFDFTNRACWDGTDLSPLVTNLAPNGRDGGLVSDLVSVTTPDGIPDFDGGGVGHIYVDKEHDTELDDLAGASITIEFLAYVRDDGETSASAFVTTLDGNAEGFAIITQETGSNAGWTSVRLLIYRDGTDSDFIATNAMKLNAWNHVVVTSTFNSSAKIYVNGDLKTNTTDTVGSGTLTSDASNGLRIADEPYLARMINGKLAKFRLWKRELTADQVSRLYWSQAVEVVPDGDVLPIDFTPTNYTPDATPDEAFDVDDLAAHLKGVDTAVGNAAAADHDATHITGGSDEIDGDKIDIDWDPTNYTPDLSPTEVDNVDNLTSHLKGIDDTLAVLSAQPGVASFMEMSLSANQTTNLGVGDQVEFNTINAQQGVDITLDTTTNVGRVTLKGGLSYRLMATVHADFTSGADAQFAWYDVTNAASIGGKQMIKAPSSGSLNATTGMACAYVSPAVDTEYELQVVIYNNADEIRSGQSTRAYIEALPGPGQEKSFMMATMTSNQTTNLTAGNRVAIDTQDLNQGNQIGDLTSNQWVLKAGRTYLLKADLSVDFSAAGGIVTYQWRDNTGATGLGATAIKRPHDSTITADEMEMAIGTFTPSVDSTVEIRIVSSTSLQTVFASYSWATIETIDGIPSGDPISRVTPVKTGAYTAAIGETVRVDPSSAGFTVTLPTAAGNTGRTIHIKNTTTSTNTVTVDGDGSETIDGSTTRTLTTAYESMTVQSDGTNWMRLG